METKNGLDVVFTIRETPTFSDVPAPAEAEEELEELPPQAVRPSEPIATIVAAARTRRVVWKGMELNIESPIGCGIVPIPDNGVMSMM
jgi:hypothetical protein